MVYKNLEEFKEKKKVWDRKYYETHREKLKIKAREWYRKNKKKHHLLAKKRCQKIKMETVKKKGGKCIICSYSKCVCALEFHHFDPLKKSSKERIGSENPYSSKFDLNKVVLVCANCHREIHYGLYPKFLLSLTKNRFKVNPNQKYQRSRGKMK